MLDRKYLEQIARKSKPNGLPILVDRPCRKCRYNLKGLSASAICPECGTPITGSDEKEWKDPFPDDPSRARDQSAGLMAFEVRDLRRLATGTTLQSVGLTLVALGLFIYNITLLASIYFDWSLAEAVVTVSLGGLCTGGGLMWALGGFFTLARRRGDLDLKKFHRNPPGALGTFIGRMQRKRLERAHAVGPGDYLSNGKRAAIQWVQFLLPLASGLNALFFLEHGWDVDVFSAYHVPAADMLTASQILWGVAVIAMLPMVMFLFDLSRAAGDDTALNRIAMSLWCVVVGAFSMLFILLVIPFMGLVSGPIGFALSLTAYFVYPGGLLLPLGLLSLGKTCRWAPSMHEAKTHSEAGRIAPKIVSHTLDGKARKCQQCGFNLQGRKFGCRCPECNYQESE